MLLITLNTVVSWASAHSRASAHVAVLAVRMESAYSWAGSYPGNVSQDHSDDEADENAYEGDGDIDDLDPFSDSDE